MILALPIEGDGITGIARLRADVKRRNAHFGCCRDGVARFRRAGRSDQPQHVHGGNGCYPQDDSCFHVLDLLLVVDCFASDSFVSSALR